jgi:hypothetical protein
MMCFLVRKTLFIPLIVPIPAVLSDNTVEAGEEWSGIYFKNTKIGYTASSRKKTQHGYLFSESAVMDLMMMNVPQHLKTTLYAKTDADLALRTFSFSLTSGIIKLSVSGEVVSNKMHLKIDTGGVIEDKKILLTAVPVLESGLKYKLIGTGLSRGNKIKSTVFDPFSMSGREISAEVEGREQIYIKNKAYDCFRIRQSFNGITVYTWVTDTGETLQEQSPMGFMLIQEPPDLAVSGIRSDKSIDVTSATGITSNRLLPDRTITYLKIRLLNIPLDGFALNGGRQKLTNDTVEITREEVNGSDTYAIPYVKTEYAAFLKATAFIQSDTQELSEQAK